MVMWPLTITAAITPKSSKTHAAMYSEPSTISKVANFGLASAITYVMSYACLGRAKRTVLVDIDVLERADLSAGLRMKAIIAECGVRTALSTVSGADETGVQGDSPYQSPACGYQTSWRRYA